MELCNKILIIILSLLTTGVYAQDRYVVYFTDKDNNTYSLETPEEFLSDRSLARRSRQEISLVEADLPVTESYLQTLRGLGIRPYYSSKWLNAALIQVFPEDLAAVEALPFVSGIELVAYDPQLPTGGRTATPENSAGTSDQGNIAYEWHGINRIHENRNFGAAIRIAVMDANFFNVNILPEFAHLFEKQQVVMAENLVNASADVYQGPYNHGTRVLSILAGMKGEEFIGIAPESDYLLFQTEDAPTENRVEEFNWTVAAEKADSAGADIITSSLGYSYGYSDPSMNYTYEDMDGETTMISRAARRAVETGMIVVSSAGNEGNSGWKYVTAPADVENVLTVGAVSGDSMRASFSSFGPTYDGRTKPDIVSLGVQTPQINHLGQVIGGNGTSFSAPIIAGFAALLWQEYPSLTNFELMDLIRSSGHLAGSPSNEYGYGIPNIQIVLANQEFERDRLIIYPVPARDIIFWKGVTHFDDMSIHNLHGQRMETRINATDHSIFIDHIPDGVYILTVISGNAVEQIRFVKK